MHHFCRAYISSILLVLLLLLCFGPNTRAQSPLTKNYTVKDGLPSSETHDIFQDSKGYIWIATDRGVCRFDGYRFETFNTTNGLPDNTIFEVYEDHKHRIWFRSYSGRLSYYLDGKIYSLSINEEIVKAHNNGHSTSIYVDKGDTVWIGMRGIRIVKIIAKENEEKVEVIVKRQGHFYISGEPGSGYIWAGGYVEGNLLQKIFINEGEGREYTIGPPTVSDGSLPNVLRRKNGDYLLAKHKTLYVAGANGLETFDIPGKTIAVREDRKGNVWIPYRHYGLALYAGGDFSKQPKVYFKDIDISDIYEDNEGGLWFASLTNGIFYMTCRDIRTYNNRSVNRNAREVAKINDSIVAVGYDNGLMQRFNVNTENYTEIPDAGAGYIQDISPDEKGNVWIGGGSLVKSNQSLSDFPEHYPVGIKKIAIESDTSILLAHTSSLCRITSDKKVKALAGLFMSTADNSGCIPYNLRLYTLFIDHSKRVWMGTLNGLHEYTGKSVTHWGEKFPLLKHNISSIIEPAPGVLWLASVGRGIIILDLNKNSIAQLSAKDGLMNDMCSVLFMDASEAIWAGTNNGLSKITKKKNSDRYVFTNLSMKNGLVSNEIESIAEAGGKIWVGTTDGVSVFDPSVIEMNTLPPPVYITSVTIHSSAIPLQTHYELDHDKNFISIKFIGLSYRTAGSVMYKLKMQGIDKDWLYTTQPNIQYTTIPPGSYTFSVYAMNNDGVWSTHPATLSFTISPPYWETVWFRVGLALVVLGIIVLVFMIRYRYLKKTEKEKNELYRKIVDTELKALRAQMNPHFIFNSLNSIQCFILDNDTRGAYKYLGKFSKMVRQTLNNSRKEMITLAEELDTLKLYIELESLRFKNAFAFNIEVNEDIDPEDIKVPALIIQPFVENAIWHGLMPKGEKGMLSVKLETSGNTIKCIIEDNGVGRKKAAMTSSFKDGHESMGIAVTRERLEALNAKYNVSLTLDIIDLYDSSQAVSGTRVELFFPLIPNL